MIYALEASAVPELTTVGKIINCQAGREAIKLLGANNPSSLRRIVETEVYSLEDFFFLHIHDFERAHESRLKSAITADFSTDSTKEYAWRQFICGSYETWNFMDQWWEALSQIPLPVGP